MQHDAEAHGDSIQERLQPSITAEAVLRWARQ